MNAKHFLRQLTPPFSREYCARRGLQLPPTLTRGGSSDKVSNGLADFVVSCDDEAADQILLDVARCDPFVAEQGQAALLMAIQDDPGLVLLRAELANPQEQAVWVLLNHSKRFEIAEAFLFADYRAEGRYGRDFILKGGGAVSADLDVHKQFALAISTFFRRHDGSGRHCTVEVTPRGGQDIVQVTIYIEGLQRSAMQSVGGKFIRVNTRPAIEAAMIYSQGRLTVVAAGGRAVQEQLHRAFAVIMLQAAPGSAVGKQGSYLLDQLVPDRGLPPLPSLGVTSARVRKLRLRPRDGGGVLTVEAPRNPATKTVFDVSERWFTDGSGLLERFLIDGVTITLHYARQPDRARAKAINIEMTRSGTSNVRKLPASDRRVAEAHLHAWGLVPAP